MFRYFRGSIGAFCNSFSWAAEQVIHTETHYLLCTLALALMYWLGSEHRDTYTAPEIHELNFVEPVLDLIFPLEHQNHSC